MADYDPNLPQEFAHMPKKRGLGAIMIVLAVVAVFVLSALFATLRHQAPADESPVTAQEQPAPVTDAPPVAEE